MSRAFVKEDIEVPDRPLLRKTASGLPPGAANLMTEDGASELRAHLRTPGLTPVEADALAATLASATVVSPQKSTPAGAIVFGSRVTVRRPDGSLETRRIVGADEIDLAADNVSWLSPLGKALLASHQGRPVRLPGDTAPFGIVEAVS